MITRRRGGAAGRGSLLGVATLALALVAVGASAATVQAQEISVGGQVRPRLEHQTGATGEPTPDPFTSLRTRVNLEAKLGSRLRGFAQLQDVRGWGAVPGAFPNGGNGRTELHQGYLEVGALNADRFSMRAGRQEVGFGGERLVGAVDWTQQARALDGLRTRARLQNGVVDLFAFRVDDRAASTPRDGALAGTYATLGTGPRTLDLYGLYNHLYSSAAAGAGAATAGGTNQGTVGARLAGAGDVAYRVEAAYQFGEREGREVSAYLLGGRVGTTLAGGRIGLTAWYDYLSGSATPGAGRVRVFDTLLGTNHKYYGYADLFTNIPVHTAGRGLQDLALKSSYRLSDAASLGLDLHSFHLARSAGLASGRLGEELDLTAKWRLSRRLEVSGGVSHLIGGEALRALGRLEGNRTNTFLMVNTTF